MEPPTPDWLSPANGDQSGSSVLLPLPNERPIGSSPERIQIFSSSSTVFVSLILNEKNGRIKKKHPIATFQIRLFKNPMEFLLERQIEKKKLTEIRLWKSYPNESIFSNGNSQ